MTLRTQELAILKCQAVGRYIRAEVEFNSDITTAVVSIVAPGPWPTKWLGKPEKVRQMLAELAKELRDVLRWLDDIIAAQG